MDDTTRPTVDEVVAAHGELVSKGGGWAGPCPACGGEDRFHVKARPDGRALVGCRGCIDGQAPADKAKAWGLIWQELFGDRAMPGPRQAKGNGRALVGNAQPKSREGLRAVLGALGYEWRYNIRAMRAELRHHGGVWREANDRLVQDFRSQIPERFTEQGKERPLMFGRVAFEDCFGALLNRAEVDPFREWLESLPPWYGEQRLNRWISHVFDIPMEQAGLAAWSSCFLLLGAVWRTYRPGAKLDEMPVIIGGQGIGKSSAASGLLPPDHPEWFSDGLRLAVDDKVRVEALQGRVIVEAAEMAGSTRAERESLKAFISRTDDGSVRLAWRRNPETMLRRCVMLGTSNDPHCLPDDPSGNRRFVVLHVRPGPDGAAGVRMYLNEFREQLWSEALHRYREGETAYLPVELATVQAKVNRGAVQPDETLEDAVLAFLETWGETKPFRQDEVRRYISGRIGAAPMPSHKRLAVELQRLECECLGLRRVDGQRGRWWTPPVLF